MALVQVVDKSALVQAVDTSGRQRWWIKVVHDGRPLMSLSSSSLEFVPTIKYPALGYRLPTTRVLTLLGESIQKDIV